jgi:ribosomal protein S18 acetylase RimI-like enzyme
MKLGDYMKIVEYEDKYLEDVRDLLVELEEYLISIDEDHLDQIHEEYREKMALVDLKDVNDNNGKCYLAIDDNKAIGLIMGTIPPYDEYDYLDYKCPKRGRIIELIVTSKVRSKGIGQALIDKMEEYFKSVGCEYVLVDVFGYNDNALKFYFKKGYHARMLTTIKKL